MSPLAEMIYQPCPSASAPDNWALVAAIVVVRAITVCAGQGSGNGATVVMTRSGVAISATRAPPVETANHDRGREMVEPAGRQRKPTDSNPRIDTRV